MIRPVAPPGGRNAISGIKIGRGTGFTGLIVGMGGDEGWSGTIVVVFEGMRWLWSGGCLQSGMFADMLLFVAHVDRLYHAIDALYYYVCTTRTIRV